MPLIIITGHPCTGKTTFANNLVKKLKLVKDSEKIFLINEESLHYERDEYYQDASHEKTLRQSLKSAVDHALNADTFVILDSLNYIKGYRYELYCLARSQRTPHCVVHVDCSYEVTLKWNITELGQRWPLNILQDLRMRYEKPNSSNRWDKPLFFVDMTPQTEEKGETAASDTLQNGTEEPMKSEFILIPSISEMTSEPPVTVFSSWKSAKKSLTPSVISQSATSTTARDSDQKGVYFSGNKVSDVATICEESRTEALNFPDQVIDEILSYFETAVAPAPNLATKPVRHAGPELLYQLDRVSQTIVQLITAHQQEHTDGTPLILKDFNSHVLVLPRYVGAQELQRLRRQFVKMNSSHPPENSVDVGGKFVEFLRTQVV